MTYPMYEKNGNWFRSLREVEFQPDRTIYIEHPDSIYPNETIEIAKYENLVEEINNGYYYDGMHGYKIPVSKIEEEDYVLGW